MNSIVTNIITERIISKEKSTERIITNSDGSSAYQTALKNGFIGTESEWLLSLVGAQGIQGNAGIDGTSFQDTFETVSKNLKGNPCVLQYTLGALSSIIYTVPMIGTITKTFNNTGSKLTSIVLSGDTPSGINLTKTFNYTGDTLSSISYS